jgi:hypothetical protein
VKPGGVGHDQTPNSKTGIPKINPEFVADFYRSESDRQRTTIPPQIHHPKTTSNTRFSQKPPAKHTKPPPKKIPPNERCIDAVLERDL